MPIVFMSKSKGAYAGAEAPTLPQVPMAKRSKERSLVWRGIPITIENPKGSYRYWKDSKGLTRFTEMQWDYGEFDGTIGFDDDPIDVIIGPNLEAPNVYVCLIGQKPDFESLDEEKVLIGFSSKEDAVNAMAFMYDDPRFVFSVRTVGVGYYVSELKQRQVKPLEARKSRLWFRFRHDADDMEKARRVREYYRRDETGQLIHVQEHWDSRDPAKPRQVTEQYVFGGQLEPGKQPRNVKPITFKTAQHESRKPPVTPPQGPLFNFGAEQKRKAEEAKRAAEAKDPKQENLRILSDLLAAKGIRVHVGETSRGKSAIEIFGNTYEHVKKFQAIKGSGVWGEKNARGSFAWWTDHDKIGIVIKQFGGKPYAAPERIDTSGRGAEPEGRPALSAMAPSGAGESPARGDGDRDATRSRQDERGSLPESASSVRGGETGQPQRTATESPPVSAGIRPERRDYRGYGIEQLIAVKSPEPQAVLTEGLDSTLKGFQQQTVRLATDAYRRGDRGFLLGDGTGTGKTYSALGIARQIKPTRALIVVPNQGIAQQWKEVAEQSFGLSLRTDEPQSSSDAGLFVMTYAKLRDLRKDNKLGQPYGPHAGGFDLCIFDEAHQQAMKVRQGGQTARLVQDVAAASKFSVYSTATPFERPQDAQYLGAVGLWPHQRDAFKNWAAEHGVRWDTETIYVRGGMRREVSKPKFIGTQKGKLHDMLRIRAAILGNGKGVFNELKIDQPMTTEFFTIPTEGGPFGEQVVKALKALDALPPSGLFAAARVNLAKRLLDYVKLDAAVGDALAAAKEGKRVAVFVSNKSPFQFALPDDAQEIEGLGAIAQQIRQAFKGAGLTGSLPSPTEYLANKLKEQLGEKLVEEYTGDVSDAKRARIKKDFQQGKLSAIVASIAAGGTGLSLHDTVGNAPRHQVNIGLPWSGKDFFQLVGRTYREGTASPVTQHFLLAHDPYEQRLAQIVAGKAESMGATVRGVSSDKNVDNLAQFSVMGMFEQEDDGEPGTLAPVQGGWGKSFGRLLFFLKAVTDRGARTGGYYRRVWQVPGKKVWINPHSMQYQEGEGPHAHYGPEKEHAGQESLFNLEETKREQKRSRIVFGKKEQPSQGQLSLFDKREEEYHPEEEKHEPEAPDPLRHEGKPAKQGGTFHVRRNPEGDYHLSVAKMNGGNTPVGYNLSKEEVERLVALHGADESRSEGVGFSKLVFGLKRKMGVHVPAEQKNNSTAEDMDRQLNERIATVKQARTSAAALDKKDKIDAQHIAEAVQYEQAGHFSHAKDQGGSSMKEPEETKALGFFVNNRDTGKIEIDIHPSALTKEQKSMLHTEFSVEQRKATVGEQE